MEQSVSQATSVNHAAELDQILASYKVNMTLNTIMRCSFRSFVFVFLDSHLAEYIEYESEMNFLSDQIILMFSVVWISYQHVIH